MDRNLTPFFLLLPLSAALLLLFYGFALNPPHIFSTNQHQLEPWEISLPHPHINTPTNITKHADKQADRHADSPDNQNANTLRQLYLSWMKSVSHQDPIILAAIYDEVAHYELKDLLLAIVYNESWPKFDPWSYSQVGAMCLMQVNPKVWVPTLRKQGILKRKGELWRIDTCIKAGHFILQHYLNKFDGDLIKALTAYVGGDPSYAPKVLLTLHTLKRLQQQYTNSKVKLCLTTQNS